jgi:hypothetical protein
MAEVEHRQRLSDAALFQVSVRTLELVACSPCHRVPRVGSAAITRRAQSRLVVKVSSAGMLSHRYLVRVLSSRSRQVQLTVEQHLRSQRRAGPRGTPTLIEVLLRSPVSSTTSTAGGWASHLTLRTRTSSPATSTISASPWPACPARRPRPSSAIAQVVNSRRI